MVRDYQSKNSEKEKRKKNQTQNKTHLVDSDIKQSRRLNTLLKQKKKKKDGINFTKPQIQKRKQENLRKVLIRLARLLSRHSERFCCLYHFWRSNHPVRHENIQHFLDVLLCFKEPWLPHRLQHTHSKEISCLRSMRGISFSRQDLEMGQPGRNDWTRKHRSAPVNFTGILTLIPKLD